MKRLQSSSSAETAKFGNELAQKILAGKLGQEKNARAITGAVILALQGDLGAGKTTFTQGFARGLGIKRKPNSPTFVIMKRYPIRGAKVFKNLHHLDAYRLKKADALEMLGFRDIIADSSAIVLIEWPENVKKLLPKRTIWLKFSYGKKENERIVQ